MSAEQDTKDALFASTALLALVGVNLKGTAKIFPDEIPEDDTVPAVVYERAGTQPEYTLDGELAASLVSMTTTSWAKTRADANAIALAVTNAMNDAGLSPAKRASQDSGESVYEPELEEYGAIRVFDVWEL